MTIGESIDVNLSGFYNIEKQIINFKDYGSNSSRTRTLVIGVRKDLKDITPYDIFPSKENNHTVKSIIDYGENGFNGVKIETIGIILKNLKNEHYDVKIESYITQSIHYINNENLFDSDFNTWLIYKNEFFIKIKETLLFVIYTSFRDRIITKKLTKNNGKIRVFKSRNICNNKVINIENYDTYINSLENLAVAKFINSNTILVPNLTYNPRACFMPENCIADGSVAI